MPDSGSQSVGLIDRFLAWAGKQARPTLIAILTTGVLAVGAVRLMRAEADQNIATWLVAARHQTPPDSASLDAADRTPANLSERLGQQRTEIPREAFYHLTVTKGFARYQFSAVTVATIAAVLAGILLVPISWNGWQQANPWFVAYFLSFAATASVFSASNRIYRQADAVAQHSRLYSAYLVLDDELLTFRASEHSADDTLRFVMHVDSTVAALRTLGVNLDPDAAPSIRGVLEEIPGASAPR